MFTCGIKVRALFPLNTGPLKEFGFVQIKFRQRDVNSRTINAKVSCDLGYGLTCAPTARDFVHVYDLARSTMLHAVFLVGQNRQILDFIIGTISVFVMNFFLRTERPTKVCHHDQTVFGFCGAVSHLDPAITRYGFSGAVHICTTPSAIRAAHARRRAASNVARQSSKGCATMRTSYGEPSVGTFHKELIT